MQTVAVILAIIDIALILGPIAGALIVYNNNWEELVIPPELSNMIGDNGDTLNPLDPQTILNDTSNTQEQWQISQPVVTEHNFTARTVIFSLNFTNPLAFDFTLEALTGTVRCKEHKATLGTASLNGAVPVKASQTTQVSATCTWTQEGENHFLSSHSGASTIDVELVDTTVKISGITIQLPDPIEVPNVPLKQP